MFKSLWFKFLVLLVAVSLTALSAAFMLRELMLSDFREYLEGEREDRIYWVTAALESSYDRTRGWSRKDLSENAVWAFMLGFDIKVYDSKERLVMDTPTAIQSQPDNVVNRVMSLSESEGRRAADRYTPYPLFLGGDQIGRLDVSFLRPQKESVFVTRSNELLLLSLIVLGGVALIISIFFSRRLTNPIKRLTIAASDISSGNLKSRVIPAGSDEIARLALAFNSMAQSLEIQESLRRKLTSNIAHELRTPISAIRGELEAMIDGLIPVDANSLQSLHAEINRLRKIIEGIEDLSHAEASSRYIRKEVLSAEAFIGGIFSRMRLLFDDKGVGLDLHVNDDIMINADPDRLSQVLINLLSNALRATETGGCVSVSISEPEKSRVCIEVADSGHGISPDDLPFIFERFYRGESGGLGIGLTIVKEIVEAHGGKISVESTVGIGTKFIIELPK